MENFKQKLPIGLVIKRIAEDKNLSANDLAKKVGYSRQGVYSVFGRTKMSNEEIELWANALGVNKEEIASEVLSSKSKDNVEKEASDYLRKYIQELETRLIKQDETISHLRRVNEVLLGKSASVLIAGFTALIVFVNLGTLSVGGGYFF